MLDRAGGAIDDQQAAAAPLGGRLLRDQVVGEIEVEIGGTQESILINTASVLQCSRGAVLVDDARAPDGLGLLPLFTEDGPQHLVEKLAVLQK